MDNKNVGRTVDVSCFLLVEDSGDSEMDGGPIIRMDNIIAVGDEDDAESCSCDIACDHDDDQMFDDFYEDLFDIDESLDYMSSAEGLGESDDQEEINKFEISLCREVMDGMEDRLFWETCIAVGYP